jgi:hypothetical protein
MAGRGRLRLARRNIWLTMIGPIRLLPLFNAERAVPTFRDSPFFSAGLVMALLLLAGYRNVVHFCCHLSLCIDRIMNSIMNPKIIPTSLTNDQKVIGIGILKWQA